MCPDQAPQPLRPARERQVLKTCGFENQQGLYLTDTKGCGEWEVSSSLAHIQTQPRTECKSNHLKVPSPNEEIRQLILKHPPEVQGSIGISPGM